MKRLLIILLLIIPTIGVAKVIPFYNPGNSVYILSDFIDAEETLLVATYTFDDNRFAKKMIELENNNVDVKLLIDDGPVGGIPDKELLCELENNGVEIFLWKSESRTYMHAKYIIKDNLELLVSTENFGYSGFSYEYGNRGFGVIVDDEETIEIYLDVFNQDIQSSEKFVCDLKNFYVELEDFKTKLVNNKEYSGEIETIFSPNSLDKILELINSAENYIYIEEMYFYKNWGNKLSPVLDVIIKKDVEVKILLDKKYNTDKNSEIISFVNEHSNMEAKFINSEELGFKALHGKLMIIDDKVFLSSINQNENSVMNNREAGLIIQGDVSNYFKELFINDWNVEITKTEDSSFDYKFIILIVIVIVAFILSWLKKGRKI